MSDQRPGPRPYRDLAHLARSGRAAELTAEERAVVGAAAGPSTVTALVLGLLGLGPVGLLPAVRSWRHGGRSSALGVVGLVTCAASTAVVLAGLLFAALTG